MRTNKVLLTLTLFLSPRDALAQEPKSKPIPLSFPCIKTLFPHTFTPRTCSGNAAAVMVRPSAKRLLEKIADNLQTFNNFGDACPVEGDLKRAEEPLKRAMSRRVTRLQANLDESVTGRKESKKQLRFFNNVGANRCVFALTMRDKLQITN